MSLLIILEGCDGSGKTTLLNQLVDSGTFGDEVVATHNGSFPGVSSEVARFYIEGMLPAVKYDVPTIMDRCWISEAPYGKVHREGKLRFGEQTSRMLERIALAAHAVVIHCDPGLEHCKKTFEGRPEDEYLESTEDLAWVYAIYKEEIKKCQLPVMTYDFLNGDTVNDVLEFALGQIKPDSVPTFIPSIGSSEASTLIIGDRLPDYSGYDSVERFPFVSLSPSSVVTYGWLCEQLQRNNIPERELQWTSVDTLKELDSVVDHVEEYRKALNQELLSKRLIIAVGDEATAWCRVRSLPFMRCDSLDTWRNNVVNSAETYPLIGYLLGMKLND